MYEGTAVMSAFLSRPVGVGHQVNGKSEARLGARDGEIDQINEGRESLYDTVNSLMNQSPNRSDESEDRSRGVTISSNVKKSMHSDFYYKLESLNEKIKLFKEVFYSSKRDEQKRRINKAVRERHQRMQEEKVRRQKLKEKMKKR